MSLANLTVLVIPSEVENEAGLGSCDIEGKAEG